LKKGVRIIRVVDELNLIFYSQLIIFDMYRKNCLIMRNKKFFFQHAFSAQTRKNGEKKVCFSRKLRGFSLVELLVVVAIIGILASIAVPNFMTAVHRAKQKSTMKDIVSISAAITDYVADNESTPAQDGTYNGSTDFYKALSPFYIKVLHINDKWGNNFRVWTGESANQYGISNPARNDILVASFGRDNKKDSFIFRPNDPDRGGFLLTRMADFNNDLIMWNGSWIRRPGTRSRRGC
jgi:prepilin-type N-terminal cleavage/methylation domain-containing protein